MSEDIAIAAPLTRRFLVKASLSVGFCAAIPPVMAQVITSPADGLVVGEVKVPAGDVVIPAYRAMPDHGGPFPTVLVVHEAFGVHEHIKDVCRRFARLGYYAISPESFARLGDAPAEEDMSKLMTEIVFKKPDAQAMIDLDATLAYAKSSGSADTSRFGVVGFCWGGRQVWLYAAHNPLLKAAVAWYGPLAWRIQQPTAVAREERDPPDIVGDLSPPVLGLYGGEDPYIPSVQIDEMKAKLATTGGRRRSSSILAPDTDSSPTTGRNTSRPPQRPHGPMRLAGSSSTACSRGSSAFCNSINRGRTTRLTASQAPEARPGLCHHRAG